MSVVAPLAQPVKPIATLGTAAPVLEHVTRPEILCRIGHTAFIVWLASITTVIGFADPTSTPSFSQ